MNDQKCTISIIGCGWLGFPLAKRLIANDWLVKGTTTSNSKIALLQMNEIEPYLLKLPLQKKVEGNLFNSDYIVINIPPGRRDKSRLANYSKSIDEILDFAEISGFVKKLIFISSTSVYGEDLDLADENTVCQPTSDTGKEILKSEMLIQKSNIPHIILRFGGLAGPNRHPGRFLAGRTDLISGNQSINFLHLEDAIGIIIYLLESNFENKLFNVVSPLHPRKKDFYIKMSAAINLMPPTFIKSSNKYRREVSVEKLLHETNYKFIFPDPMLYSTN